MSEDKLKRWDIGYCSIIGENAIDEVGNGDYVLYQDHKAIVAGLEDELEMALKRIVIKVIIHFTF